MNLVRKIPKVGKRNIVEVTWTDATSETGWFPVVEAMQHEPVQFKTLGYVLQKDKKRILLCRSIGAPQEGLMPSVGDTFIIPRGWIQKIKKLQ